MSKARLTDAERNFVLGYCYEIHEARTEEGLANRWLQGQGAGGAEIDPLVYVLNAEVGIPPNRLPPKPGHYESPWENIAALRTRVREFKEPSR